MNAITGTISREDAETDRAIEIFSVIANDLREDMDRPELWEAFPQFLSAVPTLPQQAEFALQVYAERDPVIVQAAIIVLALAAAHSGKVEDGIAFVMPLLAVNPQSPLVTGVMFFLQGMADPENPKFQLKGKICPIPFERLEVLETSSHLCCASFLKPTIGNLHEAADWRAVWNSDAAPDHSGEHT